MMSEKILLIEDDTRLAGMVDDYLSQSGFHVTKAHSGYDGLAQHDAHTYDAIILDLMLPDMDGLDVCRTLRSSSDIPVLMLTAKGDPMDRIVGLELGADDYLPKPFEPRELLARLRAILRRGRRVSTETTARFGRLEIDAHAMQARIEDRVCNLTAHQFKLLSTLAAAPVPM